MKDKRIPPNYWSCQSCPDWDDVNGCWRDVIDVYDCDEIGEDGTTSPEMEEVDKAIDKRRTA